MCIAIFNNNGLISKDALQNSWNSNSHGAGFAYINADGTIMVKKELVSFDKFYKKYVDAKKQAPESKFIIHFRIKTHGAVNLENTHPFRINKDGVFIHNGIIHGYGTAKISDTSEFNNLVLKTLPEDFYRYEGIRRMIYKVGGWSKFVFLFSNGDHCIINEGSGIWDDGNWYSNNTYKKTNYIDVGGVKQYKGTNGCSTGIKLPSAAKSVSLFDSSNLPLETKDEEYYFGKFDDDYMGLRNYGQSREVRCSECEAPLNDRRERNYGVCSKCLKEYEIY